MNNPFDELAKGLAQSVTRRGAVKKFGVGLAGVALATLGLTNKVQAAKNFHCICHKPDYGCFAHYGYGSDYYACRSYCPDHCVHQGP